MQACCFCMVGWGTCSMTTCSVMCESLDGVQAGGYFSICVCITTWWLAIAELVLDVTGKVGLSHPDILLMHSISHPTSSACLQLPSCPAACVNCQNTEPVLLPESSCHAANFIPSQFFPQLVMLSEVACHSELSSVMCCYHMGVPPPAACHVAPMSHHC